MMIVTTKTMTVHAEKLHPPALILVQQPVFHHVIQRCFMALYFDVQEG